MSHEEKTLKLEVHGISHSKCTKCIFILHADCKFMKNANNVSEAIEINQICREHFSEKVSEMFSLSDNLRTTHFSERQVK